MHICCPCQNLLQAILSTIPFLALLTMFAKNGLSKFLNLLNKKISQNGGS